MQVHLHKSARTTPAIRRELQESTEPTSPFDIGCAEPAIEHRLIKPSHPQTNGMIERFNRHISELLNTTQFRSGEHLRETLTRHVKPNNQHIPQRGLKHSTPTECLKHWYREHPELFPKRPYIPLSSEFSSQASSATP